MTSTNITIEDTKTMTREECIAWLTWCNNGNGCYSDEDNAAEGWAPITLEEARSEIQETIEETMIIITD